MKTTKNLAQYKYGLPVQTSTGEVVDITGYTEFFSEYDRKAYYFHLPKDQIAVVGEEAVPYSDWNDFLAKEFRSRIDQEKAAQIIKQRRFCIPTSKIIKEVAGVFLCEDGNIYDTSGYCVFPEENYHENIDLFEWDDYGAYYVFALSKYGRLRLVSRWGSDEFKHLTDPVVESILTLSDIEKIASRGINRTVVLHKNGDVTQIGRLPSKILNWHNMKDVAVAQFCVVGLSENGQLLYYPEKESDRDRWMPFDTIKLESDGIGKFFNAPKERAGFSAFSHVYFADQERGPNGLTIYGFDDCGNVQEFNLQGYLKKNQLPYKGKRMFCYCHLSNLSSKIVDTYVVAEDGSSYTFEYGGKLKNWKVLTI